jgi:hypothetical protein
LVLLQFKPLSKRWFYGLGPTRWPGALHYQPKGTRLMQFTLYGTSACHLCEIAEQMLQQNSQQQAASALNGNAIEYDKVDISESDTLFERYGVLIPVLQHPDGRELNWPFSQSQLEQFLAS